MATPAAPAPLAHVTSVYREQLKALGGIECPYCQEVFIAKGHTVTAAPAVAAAPPAPQSTAAIPPVPIPARRVAASAAAGGEPETTVVTRAAPETTALARSASQSTARPSPPSPEPTSSDQVHVGG